MISKLSHTTFHVLDQEKALDFYVNKLGFQKRMDYTNERGYRFLTVGPKDQPDLEIVLMKAGTGDRHTTESSKQLQSLLEKGVLSTGVLTTPNCRAMYEELKQKGVEFDGEPSDQPWGVQCSLTDGQGNWFSVLEAKAQTWTK